MALHARAKADQEARALTMSEYITMILEEQFTEREATIMRTRTMAFQVDEALFQRIKEHLRRTGTSQKDFVIGLIEQALREAEAELDEDGPAEPDDGDTAE